MTFRRKAEPGPVPLVEQIWETYGTWITGGVVVVLAGALVIMLVQRHRESRFLKGVAELENISQDDPLAAMRLEHLELDYGDTSLGPGIELKRAQMLYRDGDYDGAEKLFKKVAENVKAGRLERLEAGLGLAYVAQEKGDLAEARKRYEQVEKDGLYAFEARRMLRLLDKMEKKVVSRAEEKGTNP
jgi:predicted negative regulator of RcsB-dependent stress response